jgi:hypothetical protein
MHARAVGDESRPSQPEPAGTEAPAAAADITGASIDRR